MNVSEAFQVFMKEAPEYAKAWSGAAQGLGQASPLDRKTRALAYLSVLAAMRLTTGVAFHVADAKNAGASRAEVIGAVLLGLPAAGNCVIQSLPVALEAYDSEGR